MLNSDHDTRGTVARVVCLMRALAEAGGEVGVSELARRLQLPVSTVHRLLKLLIEEGMAERAHDQRRYRAGLELFRVGALVADKRDPADAVAPYVHRVVEECGEVCFYCLYLPAQHRVIAVHKEEARHPLRYTFDLYLPMSIMWGATGRAVLAFLPDPEVAALIEQAEPSPATGAPLPPAGKLLAELAAIRDKGYAITFGQKIPGAVGLAAPVFSDQRRPIGSLCVTIPEFRFDRKMEPRISALLTREAASLSESCGYVPGPPGTRPHMRRRTA